MIQRLSYSMKQVVDGLAFTFESRRYRRSGRGHDGTFDIGTKIVHNPAIHSSLIIDGKYQFFGERK